MARTLDDAYALDNLNVTTREDFALQMQLMTAMITDSAYRADEWASWMQMSDAADASMKMTPSRRAGARSRCAAALWRPALDDQQQGDPRHLEAEDSVKYIKPIVDNSPIEVIVVGDVGVETTIRGSGQDARRSADAQAGPGAARHP